ncbi:MAG TPA: hypothetical protein VF467_03170 [Afipia sp.]
MKKIILATICASFVAASSLPAAAASQTRKADHKAAVATEQVRNARAAVFAPQYDTGNGGGWSAPAGH